MERPDVHLLCTWANNTWIKFDLGFFSKKWKCDSTLLRTSYILVTTKYRLSYITEDVYAPMVLVLYFWGLLELHGITHSKWNFTVADSFPHVLPHQSPTGWMAGLIVRPQGDGGTCDNQMKKTLSSWKSLSPEWISVIWNGSKFLQEASTNRTGRKYERSLFCGRLVKKFKKTKLFCGRLVKKFRLNYLKS